MDSTTGSTYRYTGSAWSKVTDYSTAISNYDTSLNQQAVFNKLTNNSQNEGVYLSNNHLYINASMIKSGSLDADIIQAGILKSRDSSNKFNLDLDTGVIQLKYGANNTAWQMETGRLKMYSYRTSDQIGEISYGSIYNLNTQSYYERFEMHYPSNGSFAVCQGFNTGWTGGTVKLAVNSDGTTMTGRLQLSDGIRIVDGDSQCGLNQDSYGCALFYSRTSAENCYVRANPNGRIDISAPNGCYVNGTRIG